jgi:hypothetical protein
LPIAYFGGSAGEIYERELEAFDRKYGRRMRKEDYEQLNEVGTGPKSSLLIWHRPPCPFAYLKPKKDRITPITTIKPMR